MVQRLPIGIQNFRELREGSYYYVDKSELISQILGANGKVHLFTRPRRFGKSLNLSMLDCYFNMEYKGIADQWFDGLRIRELRPDDPVMNAYPAIYIDFKDLPTNYDSFIKKLGTKISDLFFQHKAQLAEEEDPYQREMFMSIYEKRCSPEDLQSSLQFLCEMLYRRFGKSVIVLIDEYDNPINNSNGSPDQRRILDFMRGMLSEVLKNGNMSMRFAVVTGVMQISKESIFSGLNNLKVNNIFSREFDEMFGFTPDEVRRFCEDYGHPERFEEAKEWYDGYRFGDADIYNPWSVIGYVDADFKPKEYWAGTSGNSIIDDLLSFTDKETFDILHTLALGESVNMELDDRITFESTGSSSDSIFSVMAMSGYLRAIDNGNGFYDVSIPNKEMYRVYSKMIATNLGTTGRKIRAFQNVLISGDADKVSKAIEDLLMTDLSFRILDDEATYQAYLIGLLFNLRDQYTIQAERESGKGYCDIILISKRIDIPHLIVELKHSKNEGKDLDRLASEAIAQIHDRQYYHDLKGHVLLYGMAFRSKDAVVVSEELDL